MKIMRSRMLLLLALTTVIGVGLAACGGDDSVGDATGGPADAVETAGEDAADATGDAAEGAADAAGDVADSAGDAVDDGGDVALGDSTTVDLDEQNGSGISGEVTISETESGQLEVAVTLDGDDGSTPRPAHIHSGSCETLGDVVYPLTDAADGLSTSTVDATLSDLTDGEFAINLHESADAIENYIACGSIS